MTEESYDFNKVLTECIETLALLLEFNLKDHLTHQHAIRVGEGCVLIGEKIGHDPARLKRLYFAGMIHDIGKIAVDINLLSKKANLAPDEFEQIKEHSVHGSRIVASIPELNDLAYWIRWHHERWDGQGYPDGLYQHEIPIEVQILSTMDCFDSLQTPRMDRDPLQLHEVFEIMNRGKGTFFNPEIVDLVMAIHHEGSLIPGKSSDKFLALKEKYIHIPLVQNGGDFQKFYGIQNLFPILKLFAKAIDAKHPDTEGHSTRVSILARYLAEKLGYSLEDQIKVEIAGLLHDAGKISVPNQVLNKTERLDQEEWDLIKKHPVYSSEILKKIKLFSDLADIVYHHHAWEDGRGYPQDAKQDNVFSQIIAVADAFDAITSVRSYQEPHTLEEAYQLINQNLGTQFNREVGEVLINTPPKYIKALFDMHGENQFLY